MSTSESNKKEEKTETEKKIELNSNDLTDIVFDLFFDKNFKGNVKPEDIKKS